MPREGTLRARTTSSAATSSSQWAQEQDHVIQRADGTCLYHLASVVDDHDFGSRTSSAPRSTCRTRRGRSSSPRRSAIPLPAYAHLPYVAEPGSKRKLSKRKLDAYLKNPDFAKVHEHGMAIAAAMGLHHQRPRRSTR